MTILLTGGSGMVGKNILEHPELKSFEILSPRSSELNLLSRQDVENYLKAKKPDLVIHSAGRVGGIQANIQNPVAFLTENIDMGMNLLLAAREAGVKKLLNLGSSCMYPRNAPNPLQEAMVLSGTLEPTNEGYAIAKCAISRLCDYIHQEDPSFYYKTLIPCNLYGRWDKFDPKNSHLIPAIIKKVWDAKSAGDNSVEIWGDGTARREFMYAEDLADFIVIALNHFESLDSLTNVGLGFDYSINEYYQAVAEVIGYQGNFKHDLSKPTGMKQKLVSVDKAHKLGWKAKTSLQDGIQKTLEFYQSHFLES
jgi:GDP-L-fucose synthase